MENKGINLSMIITFSKAMAFLIVVLAFLMDFLNDKGGTVFMFAIPFAVFLITGKQAIDWKKTTQSNNDTKQ